MVDCFNAIQGEDDNDDMESIYVPSAAMSEHDYGQLDTLRWAAFIRDIPVFGRATHFPSEVISMLHPFITHADEAHGYEGGNGYNQLDLSLGTHTSLMLEQNFSCTGSSVTKQLDYSWSWEALTCILADQSDNDGDRHRIPGFPKRNNGLQGCSRTDILSISMNYIINSSEHVDSSTLVESIVRWMCEKRHRQLLQSVLRVQTPRIRAFAWGLIKTLHDYTARPSVYLGTEMGSICYESMKEYIETSMSKSEISVLLRFLAAFATPGLMSDLIKRGADFDAEEICEIAISRHNYPVLKMFLGYGVVDVQSYVQGSLNEDLGSRLNIPQFQDRCHAIPIFVAQGVNLDRVASRLYPFTMAQVLAVQLPALRQQILKWTKDHITRKLIDVLDHPQRAECLSTLVPFEKQFLLLLATGFDNLEFAESLVHSGADPRCHEASTIIMNSFGRDREHLPKAPTCEDDDNYDYDHDYDFDYYTHSPDKPLSLYWVAKTAQGVNTLCGSPWRVIPPMEHAIQNRNIAMVQLLLEAGCDISFYALSDLLMHRSSDGDFFSPLVNILQCPKWRHQSVVSSQLLRWAMVREDFNLMNSLVHSGVELNPYSHDESPRIKAPSAPLDFALRWCKICVVEYIWEQGARFRGRRSSSGAYELVSLCENILAKSLVQPKEKLNFLLGKGANPHITVEDIAPLQALLNCHVERSRPEMGALIVDIAGLLLSKGVDIDSKNSKKATPLQYAARGGSLISEIPCRA